MKGAKTWVALVDGLSMKIIEAGPGLKPSVVHEETSKVRGEREHDLKSDSPGRAFDSMGAARHAMEPRTHPREHEKEVFVANAVAWLADAERQGRFDRIVIAAPSRVLGEVRAILPDALKNRLTVEVVKDLVHAPQARLEELLTELRLL